MVRLSCRMRCESAGFRHSRLCAIIDLAMKNKAISYIQAKVLPWLAQTKNYTRVVGVILFVIGLFGFAFRSDNSLPDIYLISALVLGFWGILISMLSGDGKVRAERDENNSDSTSTTPEPEV